MSDAYPSLLDVRGANWQTVRNVRELSCTRVAEFGVYHGHTSRELAAILPAFGLLDLFDFEDVALPLAEEIGKRSQCRVRGFGSSYQLRDSYCWPMATLLRENPEPIWDYVFLDGAHTWDVDGFAFLLADMLLVPGGYLDLDDYEWTLARSKALSSLAVTAQCYTQEQRETPQVAMVAEILVARRGYTEIQPRKLWRKPA